MAEWYSVTTSEETDRLLGAWEDAPTENLEVCGFLLDTARLQVLAYAPQATPAVYEPTTLTWANGWTLDLTRDGEVVTAVLTSSGNPTTNVTLPIPAQFQVRGSVRRSEYNSTTEPTAILVVNDILPAGALGAQHQGSAPAGFVLDAQWLGDPADGDGVPFNYVYAQLQQAKNLWNAGRVSSGGEVGVDQFSYTPRPLDKTIRNIIRPADGKPHVL